MGAHRLRRGPAPAHPCGQGWGSAVRPLVPNAETIAAMKEARAGNLPRFDDVESLFDDLHAEH